MAARREFSETDYPATLPTSPTPSLSPITSTQFIRSELSLPATPTASVGMGEENGDELSKSERNESVQRYFNLKFRKDIVISHDIRSLFEKLKENLIENKDIQMLEVDNFTDYLRASLQDTSQTAGVLKTVEEFLITNDKGALKLTLLKDFFEQGNEFYAANAAGINQYNRQKVQDVTTQIMKWQALTDKFVSSHFTEFKDINLVKISIIQILSHLSASWLNKLDYLSRNKKMLQAPVQFKMEEKKFGKEIEDLFGITKDILLLKSPKNLPIIFELIKTAKTAIDTYPVVSVTGVCQHIKNSFTAQPVDFLSGKEVKKFIEKIDKQFPIIKPATAVLRSPR